MIQRLLATPPWADFKKIRAVYAEARRKTESTGELHVVDHDYPLNGGIVCGLHVHTNLRVRHWRDNGKKGCGLSGELFTEPEQLRMI
jgi:hypothetical protein